MNKINWGIIGLGNIANKFAEGCIKINNASIKGIASQNRDKLSYFQQKFHVEDKFCFNNYDDLILCPDIDIIYIALPNSLHALYIDRCIKNNKNVLVEKPAFTNILDLQNIKKLHLDKKVYFTEGFMYRYLPYFQKIKEILHSNVLGNILNIESTFNIRVYKQKNFLGFKIRKPDYTNRLFNKKLGGGAILDVGCYPLSLSTFINSSTYNVATNDIKLEKVNTLYCESGVDIFSEAKLNFNDKFISKITCSLKDKTNQSTKISFENGSLYINETWVPKQNMIIELNDQEKKTEIKFTNSENIYSYQIQNISNQLLDKNFTPNFPSITIGEIEINTKILEDWINFK